MLVFTSFHGPFLDAQVKKDRVRLSLMDKFGQSMSGKGKKKKKSEIINDENTI